MKPDASYILLDDQISKTVRFYENPVAVLRADEPSDIESVFEALAQYHRQGYFLAGYCAYELGYALEPKFSEPLAKSNALQTPNASKGPLLLFGVFSKPNSEMPPSLRYSAKRPELDLRPIWTEAKYLKRFNQVVDYIKAGDVYQINLTFPTQGQYTGDAASLYAGIRRRQPGHFGGVISLFETDIITFSPELFFKKQDDTMSMRPMKGTRPRDLDPALDSALIAEMQAEPKSRAENLMIVDLLRNDLSRISVPGSVKVPELFSVETYPTLHQMISKIESRLLPRQSFRDIFKSLFPCGSVTGAPKIRAMEIIRELETVPRGAYCGALGYIDPDGSACFNVGIRTLSLTGNALSYGIGSGIVLDSDGPSEYKECLLKADILNPPPPDLIETFRWDPSFGFKALSQHLNRLSASSKTLGYPFQKAVISRALDVAVSKKNTAQRVRLSLTPSGFVSVKTVDFLPFDTPLKLVISKYPMTKALQLSEHKTSARDFYDGERHRLAQHCGADEVLFTNSEGFLCEGSFTSFFIKRGKDYLTPPLSCGLLPGILRAEMIESGATQELKIKLEDLLETDTLYVGNSMRGLMPAQWLSKTPQ